MTCCRDLHLAFDLRHDADYRALATPEPAATGDLLGRAERFVQVVDHYLKAHTSLPGGS